MMQRILLADDHEIFREGLQVLLAGQEGFEVVGQVGDGRAALAAVRELKPHQVVMDLEMAGMNGVDATRRIVSEHPGVKVTCLSMHAEPHFIEAALEAGASGYVVKEQALEELVRALHSVAAGQLYVCAAVTRYLVEALRNRPAERGSVFGLLTGREREVLQLLAEGLSSKEIAGRLEISVKTVGSHRERIIEKTGLHSVAGLTKYAVSQGLTDLGSAR